MEIRKQVALAPFTTFKIGGPARFFAEAHDIDDLREALDFAGRNNLNVFVLGGGSNLLVSDGGFDGLVVRFQNKGIEVLEENGDAVKLQLASGEVWDEAAAFAVNNGWWGIENLSHIPGSCGAFAVQNVGAYGQEASQVIDYVVALDCQSRQVKRIANKDCGFGYRSSIFNTSQKGKYVILQTIILLQKNGGPNLAYADLKNEFDDRTPDIREVRRAIIQIRDKKFPFPQEAKNGSAGSFFKNFTLGEREFAGLLGRVEIRFGTEAAAILRQKARLNGQAGTYKVPTAYLMELCGLKGEQRGGARINPSQPLVVLNAAGSASAADVLELAAQVRKILFEKFGLAVEYEPEMVGF